MMSMKETSLPFAIDSIVVVLGGGRVELPPFAIPLFYFFDGVQRFVIFVGQADSFTELLDYVLIGRWSGAAHSFVADIGSSPIGVEISAGKLRRARVMLSQLALEQFGSRAQPRCIGEFLCHFVVWLVLFAFSIPCVYEFFLP